MKRFLVATVLLASTLVAPAAFADSQVLDDAGIDMTFFPEKWNADEADGVYTMSDPKEEAAIAFILVPADQLKAALNGMDKEIGKVAKNVKLKGKAREVELNGMKAVVADATGKVDGKAVMLSSMVVKTSDDQALLVIGIVETAKFSKHEKTLAKVMKGLEPMAGD